MKKILVKIICLFALFSFTACSDDYDVDFCYVLGCSSDLLQFVTPVVKITNANGSIDTIELNESDWDKSSNGLVVIKTSNASFTISKDLLGEVWTKTLHYSDFNVSTSMEVSYERKPNMPQIDPDQYYTFAHSLSCVIDAYGEDKGFCKGTTIYSHQDTEVNVPQKDIKKGYEVEEYLNELQNSTDKISCSVDGEANIKKQ